VSSFRSGAGRSADRPGPSLTVMLAWAGGGAAGGL
jgi:hypothetical protein